MHLGLKSTIKKLKLTPPQETEDAEENTEFFNSKEITAVTDGAKFTSQIRSLGDTVSVYLEIKDNTVISAAFSDGKTAYYSSGTLTGTALITAISPILADETVKKYVFGIQNAFVVLNGLLPKNPRYADNGLGCGAFKIK